MTSSPAARQAAALASHLPGQVETLAELPAIAMPMHLALDSHAVLVKHGSGQVFAKTFKGNALAPFDFAGAAEAAKRAGDAGIGPKLIAADAAQSTLIFEALGEGWRMAMAPDLVEPPLFETVIHVTREWHRQPALTRHMSAFEVAQDLIARLSRRLAANDLAFKSPLPFAQMREWIEMIGKAMAAAGQDSCPVHGENTASNVMIGPEWQVMLVDFDRSVTADPFWDLGALSLDLCRTEAERQAMVEVYFGKMDERALARLKLMAIVDDFLWGAWALLAELDPELAGPELYKYAGNRFLRLGHHLSTLDPGNLLARI